MTHNYLVLFSWNILSDPQLQVFLDSGNLGQAVSPRTNQNAPPETVSRSDFSGCLTQSPEATLLLAGCCAPKPNVAQIEKQAASEDCKGVGMYPVSPVKV